MPSGVDDAVLLYDGLFGENQQTTVQELHLFQSSTRADIPAEALPASGSDEVAVPTDEV